MTLKKKILISIACLTGISCVIFLYLGKSIFPIISLGAISMFLVYSLLEANPKHKDFGYMDQQRAMRAFDRTDILSFISGSDKKKKKG